jgi:hypothetical protein
MHFVCGLEMRYKFYFRLFERDLEILFRFREIPIPNRQNKTVLNGNYNDSVTIYMQIYVNYGCSSNVMLCCVWSGTTNIVESNNIDFDFETGRVREPRSFAYHLNGWLEKIPFIILLVASPRTKTNR